MLDQHRKQLQELVDRKQCATFTKWVNAQYTKGKEGMQITTIEKDLSDGIALIRLMKCLTPDQKIPTYNRPATLQPQKLNNLDIAFQLIAKAGVRILGVGTEDVLRGDMKLILGLMWAIIYAIQIGRIPAESGARKSGADGLLLWCQKNTAGYENVHVKDFSSSWKGGLALAALINKFHPELVSFDGVKQEKPESVINTCFGAAETLGIPKLLEVDDLLTPVDEKSIMTYISEYFILFSKKGEADMQRRRIKAFGQYQSNLLRMISEYKHKMTAELEWGNSKKADMDSSSIVKNFLEIKAKLDAHNEYRKTEKREHLTIKNELDVLLSNIQMTCQLQKRLPFQPPAGLAPEDLNLLWQHIDKLDGEYYTALRELYQRERAAACREYATGANDLYKKMSQKLAKVNELGSDNTGTLAEQMGVISQVEGELAEERALYDRVSLLADQLHRGQVNIDDIADTSHQWDELEWQMQALLSAIEKKKGALQAAMEAEKKGGVTSEMLEECQQIFRKFDYDTDGNLTLGEFQNCLMGLGIAASDEEVQASYKQHTSPDGLMLLDDFIKFITSVWTDTGAKEQVLEGLRFFAKNKEFITKEELESAMGAEAAEAVIKEMPAKETGYDYKAYVASTYGS